VYSHAPVTLPAIGPDPARGRRPLATLGAVAATLLLLTTACEGTKNFACKSSAAIDGLFGTEPSAERSADCTPEAGQAAHAADDAATKGAKQAARPAGPQSNPETVTDLQKRLKALGYDPGPADGQLGPKTRAAIRAYQKNKGLEPDGQITAGLMAQIEAE
jgi:hypothetical protein